MVTAVDGQVTGSGSDFTVAAVTTTTHSQSKRSPSDYEQVFSGTGSLEADRDGSIQGTAYLTYTVVSNATYDVNACLAFCDRVDGCGELSHSTPLQ